MNKKTEEKLNAITGIFAFIGICSTIVCIYDLFDKDVPTTDTTICEEYVSKIENLEIEIEELKSDLSIEEDKNRELESKVEAWKEEYEILKDAKGCDTGGSAQLTDGPSRN